MSKEKSLPKKQAKKPKKTAGKSGSGADKPKGS
jgi:hypothetical protein